MPRGTPDFSNVLSSPTQHRLLDLGELAARLWSPVVVEQGGALFYMDDFANGLQSWVSTVAGTGAAVVLHAGFGNHGGFSAKLTGGSDGDGYASIWTLLPFPVLAYAGFESAWTLAEETKEFQIDVRLYTGALYLQATVWYSWASATIQYLDEDGNTATLATNVDLRDSDYLFHTMKLIIDFDNNAYHRVLLDQTSYDMKSIKMQAVANVTPASLRLWLKHYSNAGNNAISYLDSVIVTRNEP